MLEFDITHSKIDLFERLETTCKNNELFLAEWEIKGDTIRILSEFGEIKQMLFKEFDQFELDLMPFCFVPMEDEN
jgi:hypothetical protein